MLILNRSIYPSVLMAKVTTNKSKITFGRTKAGLNYCCLKKSLILFQKVKRIDFCDRNAKAHWILR